MKEICYSPMGIIRSPFHEIQGMPIQSKGAQGIRGTVEMRPDLVSGLKDLEGFSHIILIYHFHRSRGFALYVKPFLDDYHHGVFATRAPNRPNPIGISVVRLINIDGHTLHIEDVDILDETPLLDIKPYAPEFDVRKPDCIEFGALFVVLALAFAELGFRVLSPSLYPDNIHFVFQRLKLWIAGYQLRFSLSRKRCGKTIGVSNLSSSFKPSGLAGKVPVCIHDFDSHFPDLAQFVFSGLHGITAGNAVPYLSEVDHTHQQFLTTLFGLK
jgi:tRNA (adenine37-N6)-methyltransferase